MILFPAIDLRDGNVVRLTKGDFDAQTTYGDNPVQVARSFQAAGAPWIHVVDLDAAKTGKGKNRLLVSAIAHAVDIPVQAGGGVRDRESAEALLDTGVRRIVLGTMATEEHGLVEWLASQYPGRIAVGLDGRGGNLAVHGWLQSSDRSVIELVRYYGNSGVAAYVVTDIERDGTLTGPDISGLIEVLASTSTEVIASGGVGTLDDLRRLGSTRAGHRGLSGVIVGKALYEGHFSVADAIAACADESPATSKPELGDRATREHELGDRATSKPEPGE